MATHCSEPAESLWRIVGAACWWAHCYRHNSDSFPLHSALAPWPWRAQGSIRPPALRRARRHHGGMRMFRAPRPARKHLLRKCNTVPAVNSCWGYGMWWLGESCHPPYFQTLYSKYVLSRRGRVRWGDSSLSANIERPQLPFGDGLMEHLDLVRTEGTLQWRLWDISSFHL